MADHRNYLDISRPPTPRPRVRMLSDGVESFRNDSLLQLFILKGVKPTGKKLGVGSYGSVLEVNKTNWENILMVFCFFLSFFFFSRIPSLD